MSKLKGDQRLDVICEFGDLMVCCNWNDVGDCGFKNILCEFDRNESFGICREFLGFTSDGNIRCRHIKRDVDSDRPILNYNFFDDFVMHNNGNYVDPGVLEFGTVRRDGTVIYVDQEDEGLCKLKSGDKRCAEFDLKEKKVTICECLGKEGYGERLTCHHKDLVTERLLKSLTRK